MHTSTGCWGKSSDQARPAAVPRRGTIRRPAVSPVTVVVLTRDEEANIARCLRLGRVGRPGGGGRLRVGRRARCGSHARSARTSWSSRGSGSPASGSSRCGSQRSGTTGSTSSMRTSGFHRSSRQEIAARACGAADCAAYTHRLRLVFQGTWITALRVVQRIVGRPADGPALHEVRRKPGGRARPRRRPGGAVGQRHRGRRP